MARAKENRSKKHNAPFSAAEIENLCRTYADLAVTHAVAKNERSIDESQRSEPINNASESNSVVSSPVLGKLQK